MSAQPKIRCAIYTRKSHEDGLEQEFNSLNAQRDACLAYITSQKSEGWTALPAHYDDGGYSGGTLERPALQQLLADIDAGRIDVIVVYKVDRLTRSLPDFARIVERLDAKGVSFVSVTQSFNTTSSMGRLTLNVLLSFAQFEREVTGERIRDKIAASKAKGMWMGGLVPLGYDAPAEGSTRMLTINPVEAETVRLIYQRYLELGSAHLLRDELEQQGIRSKQRTTPRGEMAGGQPFSRGALLHLLKNPIYIGEIPHKGQIYEGLHAPIIEADLFEAVQQILQGNARRRTSGPLGSGTSLLKGRLFDAVGQPMSPTISYGKLKRAYRYYVSTDRQQGKASFADEDRISRITAAQIEGVVHASLCKLLALSADSDWADVEACLLRAELKADSIELVLRASSAIDPDRLQARTAGWAELRSEGGRLRCVIAGRPVYRGGRTWFVGSGKTQALVRSHHDPKLIKALKSGHHWQTKLNASPLTSSEDLAKAEAHADSYVRRLGRLAFLAPDIQKAIFEGRQPAGLTAQKLLSTKLPLDWDAQRQILGFVP